MIISNRSPYADDGSDEKLHRLCPLNHMTDALGDLEAMAWLHNNQVAATLIGAARLALTASPGPS